MCIYREGRRKGMLTMGEERGTQEFFIPATFSPLGDPTQLSSKDLKDP
jgi:hypothetical protein